MMYDGELDRLQSTVGSQQYELVGDISSGVHMKTLA